MRAPEASKIVKGIVAPELRGMNDKYERCEINVKTCGCSGGKETSVRPSAHAVRPTELPTQTQMNVIERVERRAHWLTQLACGVSSMLGFGETVMAIPSMARKRDLSAIWELDPIAAPPKKVQRQLMGVEEDQPPPQDEVRMDREQRSVLELQLQYAMRKHDIERVRSISRQLRLLREASQQQAAECARSRSELRVGDECFALAKIVEWEWYHARLVDVRSREPPLQIEYIATLEGDKSKLALPVPRVNHLPIEHVRILKPEPCNGPIVPPMSPCVVVPALSEV